MWRHRAGNLAETLSCEEAAGTKRGPGLPQGHGPAGHGSLCRARHTKLQEESQQGNGGKGHRLLRILGENTFAPAGNPPQKRKPRTPADTS